MNRDEAVSLAIDSILRDGFSDITSASFEIELIEKFRSAFEADVKRQLARSAVCDMDFRPLQYVLTPKSRYVFDYRKAAIISPSCLAKFLALVFQYSDKIEAERIPVSKNIVFSYRFRPTGEGVFDKDVNYSKWKSETKKRVESGKYSFIVSCDIASFYDRVNIHRIESTLLSIGIDKTLVRHTNELLLFWSKKDSYGIPVGNVASRILAEAALIDIDQYLIHEKIEFTRYVDDYRLFAPDLLIAQAWMNKLTARLFRDGLMLNTGKTQVRKIDLTEKCELNDKKEEKADTVLKVINKLAGGYNRVARKFLMPAHDKYKHFYNIDLDSEIDVLKSHKIVEFSGIQKIVIAVLVQEKFEKLSDIAREISYYLYGLDYFIDMLIKNSDFIPNNERSLIADLYAELIYSNTLYSFEWHCASVARLLSNPAYFRKDALLHLYKSTAKDVSSYASMIALDGLKNKLTRSEFKTIREYFDRSDDWEKRRLLLLADSLPDDERKAWVKAVKAPLSNYILSTKLCDEIIRCS